MKYIYLIGFLLPTLLWVFGVITPKASASRQPVPKCFVKDSEISDRKLLKAILIATGSKNPFGYPNRNNLSALAAALCEDPTYLDD